MSEVKSCPVHFVDYPADLDECPYCVEVRREEAAKPRPPQTPGPGADQAAILVGIEALGATPAPVAPPIDIRFTPVEQTPVEPSAPEPSVADARSPMPPVPQGPDHDQPLSEALLESWKAADQNVVVLLGFASAGKSWFLTRLKHKLFHDAAFPLRAEPAFADQGARVSRSNNISSHSFLPIAGAEGAHADDVFHIVDMPGERFEGVAGIDLFGRREELLALQVCKSIIIVLPADEVLMAERAAERYALWEDEPAPATARGRGARAQQTLEAKARDLARSNPQLERFIKTLGRLQDLLSLLETGIDVDKVIAMGREGVIAHAATARRPSKPVFIGLAKADVIKDHIREIQDAYAALSLIHI